MYNIKQITNYDVLNNVQVQKNIVTNREEGTSATWDYYLVPLENNTNKLGYCCKAGGQSYPLFLTINGVEKEIQLSNRGMYEFMPEQWQDVNAEDGGQVETAKVYVTRAAVPAHIKFTLDYCYEI